MRLRSLFSLLLATVLAFTSFAQTSGPAVGSGAVASVPCYAIQQDKATAVVDAWLRIQSDLVGIRETKPNSSPIVDKMLASVGLNPGYAWCAAAQVYTNLEACRQVGVRSVLPRRAAVRVLARDLVSIGTRLPNSMAGQRGQLMCFGVPGKPTGHICMVERRRSAVNLNTLDGNTGPDGGRDGDGFYRKVRPFNGYPKLRTTHFFQFVS